MKFFIEEINILSLDEIKQHIPWYEKLILWLMAEPLPTPRYTAICKFTLDKEYPEIMCGDVIMNEEGLLFTVKLRGNTHFIGQANHPILFESAVELEESKGMGVIVSMAFSDEQE